MHLDRGVGKNLPKVRYIAEPSCVVNLGGMKIRKDERIFFQEIGVPVGSPAVLPKRAVVHTHFLQT